MLAARSSKLIASVFAPWERAFGQTAAEHLGADGRSIAKLALCLRPDPDNWAADVAEVAAACGIDEGRLSAFLRQAASVERMASAPPVEDIVDGRLMAARDRNEDDE
ncbi:MULTISPECIES: hypothetical protein [unclassified Bradyrhizobium]|uniref:hypothetical protein n=1 Tax=unclassified Bradyrhizobium TaxID=2631580 RepID=UPI00339AF721